jgi:hypothetical protein
MESYPRHNVKACLVLKLIQNKKYAELKTTYESEEQSESLNFYSKLKYLRSLSYFSGLIAATSSKLTML